MSEKHLPKHMRIGIANRIIRFIFLPLSIIAILTLLNYRHEYKQINDLCERRAECYAYCVNDNFPNLSCKTQQGQLEFQGNTYTNFYFYPKDKSDQYDICLNYISENNQYSYSEQEPERMWQAHTCFESCTSSADCLLGFDSDFRQECTAQNRGNGILCIMPDTGQCETFVENDEICYNEAKTACIKWKYIWLSILIGNILQLIFEASMLFALEITFRPTTLDKLQDPESYQTEIGQESNPDSKKELDCGKVMMKCWGELLFITSYLVVIIIFIIGITYSLKYGKPISIFYELLIALAIDQAKSLPCQFVIYWVVIRRFGRYENVNFKEWSDETIYQGGSMNSLFFSIRKNLVDFLEHKKVSQFILGMVILLCIVIFSELSLATQIDNAITLSNIYYYVNYALLTFFCLEIAIKLFAYGHLFVMEFINVFDSTIVIVSYIMLILRLKAKILGILRVLRLIKVIIEMKKVADQKKEQQQLIKEQKRQGSQMASHVEKVLDFFEKLTQNSDIPKHLQEDIQWAIDTVSSNKLYAGSFEGFKLSEERPEIKAWTDLIALKNIPINKQEMNRLKQYEISERDRERNEQERQKQITAKKNNDLKRRKDMGEADESKINLLNQSLKGNELTPVVKQHLGSNINVPAFRQRATPQLTGGQELEPDSDDEFLEITDLIDMDRTYLDNAVEKFEEVTFDSFTYCQIITTHALDFICYKIFKTYNFFNQFHIPLEKLANFTKEMQNGYFSDNSYHNAAHIVDSLQGMHYLMSVGNLKRYLKRHDILAAFVADMIHDFEHPGYTNQFVIRTKHPLAIRYSDISVLENHHLAAAFNVMLAHEENNIFMNLPLDTYQEIRMIIIEIVLNTDLSKHFTLVTELKTKLGNNFPTESIEDRKLILSVGIRVSDQFKVIRPGTIFFKWMDAMFEEFYKQGDMEKVLDLPISKFMDRENTNKEKAFSNYLNVICKPLFSTFMILINDEEINTLFKDGLEKNKKNLEQRIDGEPSKTYGKVYLAKSKETGKLVAIKKFKESDEDDEHVRKTVLREIRVLKDFKHDNIVSLLQVFRDRGKLYLVFEYVEKTVLEQIETYPNGLTSSQIKEIAYQLIKAIDFLHSHDPENLLLSNNGILKVCDFGFARGIKHGENIMYTDYVSTRWYRSPELLVGDANYNKAVDIWAIGCILAEIFNGQPLFPGDSDLHTLQLIMKTVGGKLTDKQRHAFSINPIYDGARIPVIDDFHSGNLREKLSNTDPILLDLIEKCLVINPDHRWLSTQLLEHQFFDQNFKNHLDKQFPIMLQRDRERVNHLESKNPSSPNFDPMSDEDDDFREYEQVQTDDANYQSKISMQDFMIEYSITEEIKEETSEKSQTSQASSKREYLQLKPKIIDKNLGEIALKQEGMYISNKVCQSSNNSQLSLGLDESMIQKQTTGEFYKDHNSELTPNIFVNKVKKVNITFNTQSEINSYSDNHHEQQQNMTMKQKQAQKINAFLRRNPNMMNQTARDHTPQKLQHNRNLFQQRNLKEVASLEKLEGYLPSLKASPPMKSTQKYNQIVTQNSGHSIGKSNQQPIKLIAFPKLIDQRKNNESSKSFLKINNISLNENYNQFNYHHNQSINNSIMASNGWDTRNKVHDLTILNGGNLTVNNYEMDSFPRRSITNKLKNAQALKEKKKMRVFHSNNNNAPMSYDNHRHSLFPTINNVNKNEFKSKESISQQPNIKIIDLQHNLLPSSMNANNYKKTEIYQNHSLFRRKEEEARTNGLKPKTPGEAYEYHSTVKSPSVHEKAGLRYNMTPLMNRQCFKVNKQNNHHNFHNQSLMNIQSSQQKFVSQNNNSSLIMQANKY